METFWAIDTLTGKRADQTGPCVCTSTQPWAVYAIDTLCCERVFLRHKFRFEKVL